MHGPNLIPPIAKSLICISFASEIDKNRLPVVVYYAGSQIIVVVAFIVMSTFCCEEKAIGGSLLIPGAGDLKIGQPKIGDQNIFGICIFDFIQVNQLPDLLIDFSGGCGLPPGMSFSCNSSGLF